MAFEALLLSFGLRVKLLMRQKILLGSFLFALAAALVSLVLARISWVTPQKIFWDFTLSALFVLEVFLSAFLASQLLKEELDRRTLHLVLSSGVSRGAWLVGNFLGMFASLASIAVVGFLFSFLLSKIFFPGVPIPSLAFSATLGLIFEVAVLLSFSFFVSFFVRPLLALLLTLTLTAGLHSLSSLERILIDPVTGRFVASWPVKALLWISKFFPPLEWFDLKPLVGYEEHLPGFYLVSMLGLCLFWCGFYLTLACVQFERMDL